MFGGSNKVLGSSRFHVCKDRAHKNCWVMKGGSIGGNCKDGFGNKLGGE